MKLLPPRRYVRIWCWFPPVNSGGLIEASPDATRSAGRSRPFPPVNSGGLIEADRSDPRSG